MQRKWSAKISPRREFCKKGLHALTPENTYTNPKNPKDTRCLECKREYDRGRQRQARAKQPVAKRPVDLATKKTVLIPKTVKQSIALGPLDTREVTLFYRNYKEPLTSLEDQIGYGYGYLGVLATDESGDYVQCHLCGKLYDFLPTHIRKEHDMKTAEYKELVGLAQETALVGETLRQRWSDTAYNTWWGNITEEESQRRTQEAVDRMKRYWEDVRSGKRELSERRTLWSAERRNEHGSCPEQLVEQIREVAKKLGRTPTIREFDTYAKSSKNTVKYTFGSWNNALKKAGLTTNGNGGFQQQYTEEQVVELLKEFYEQHGRSPRDSDLRRGILPSAMTINKLFGGIRNAREAAGLPQYKSIPTPMGRMWVPAEEAA